MDENNPKHYMTYTVKSSGVYRFTYKAFLNVKYTDTEWCDYVSRICPSAVTATTGVFPQNDYQTKRLITQQLYRVGKMKQELYYKILVERVIQVIDIKDQETVGGTKHQSIVE